MSWKHDRPAESYRKVNENFFVYFLKGYREFDYARKKRNYILQILDEKLKKTYT